MAAATTTASNSAPFMESQCVIQPRRLKDFLQDQNLPFPRSRKSPISVFLHAAVSSVKSSSILRRSISRRFSAKNKSSSRLPEPTMTRTTSVTVKDILRWRSFRDLADPEEIDVPQLPDFTTESPSRCTISTTTATSTTSSAATPRSSWSGSDFTVGDSPVWCRGDVTDKKNFHINVAGGEMLRRKTRDPKDPIGNDEEEQFSPISVLDFAQEHEQTFSPFHQILDNMERRNTMLKQQIQEFENLINIEDHCTVNKHIKSDDIEERAIQLLNHIKTTSSIEECDDCLLLDFIREELITTKGVKNVVEIESRVLSTAQSWVKGENDGSLEMEKLMNWKDFEEEEEEIGIEMEKIMLNYLLDELSMELLNC